MKIANDQILLMFVCFIFQQKKYQNKNLLYHGNLICFEKKNTEMKKHDKTVLLFVFSKKNTNDRMLLLGVFLKKKTTEEQIAT